jgi:hypothetical protein
MKAYLTLFVAILAVVALAASAPAYCGAPAKSELTFSAAAFQPKDGGSSWSLTGEYLIPIGDGPFLFGPSASIFDGPGTDGGAFGLAAAFNFGKTCGPGLGGAVHRLTGDAADAAAYTYEARAFFKCGSEHAFVQILAAQTWSRAADGATTDPDGTAVLGGLGWRF